jgi:S1-C subfamily serine protease
MDSSSLDRLSGELAGLASAAAKSLFHVPSPMGGRSALGFDGRLLLVPAFEASPGEELELLAPGGEAVAARVKGFDPRLGLAVLELAEARPDSAFVAAPGLPALGSLLLAAAFPSPQGPEARLELVRFAGGEGEDAYIQTDGPAFPGFSGGALVAPDGRLAAFILADRPGNRGYAIPAELASRLTGEIARGERSGFAFLGLSTLPVEAPHGWAAAFGDERREALLIAGLEEGGPAAQAGVQPGDFIASIGGRAVMTPRELSAALEAARPGQPLALRLVRAGKLVELTATPSTRPIDSGRSRMGWAHGASCCGDDDQEAEPRQGSGRGRGRFRWHGHPAGR